ncbi:MAG: hypothetical protein ACOX8S_02970 [Christensenellales bacterium]
MEGDGINYYSAYENTYTVKFYVNKGSDYKQLEFVINFYKEESEIFSNSTAEVTSYDIVSDDPEIIDPTVLSGIVTAAGNVGFEYAATATSYVISGFDSAHNGVVVTYDIAGATGATATIAGGKLSVPLSAANFSNLETDVSIAITALSDGTTTQTLDPDINTYSIKTRYGADTGATPVAVSGSFGEGKSISISPLPASDHHSMSIQLYSGSNPVGSPITADSGGTTSFSVPSGVTAGTVLTAKVTPKLPGMNNSSEIALTGQYIVPLSGDPFELLGDADASVTGATYTLSGLSALNGVEVTYKLNKEERTETDTVFGGTLSIPLSAGLYSEIGSEVYITVTKIKIGEHIQTDAGTDTKTAYVNFMGETDFSGLFLGRSADDSGFLINGLSDILAGAYNSGFSIGINFFVDGEHVANGVVGHDGTVTDVQSVNAVMSLNYIPGMDFNPGDEISGELVLTIHGLNDIIVPLGGAFTAPYSDGQIAELEESAAAAEIEYGAGSVDYVLSGLDSLTGHWISYKLIEQPSESPPTAMPGKVLVDGDGEARVSLSDTVSKRDYYSELGKEAFIVITGLSTTEAGASEGGYEEVFDEANWITTVKEKISFDISIDIEDFKGISLVYDYAAGKFKFEGLLNGIINGIPDNHVIRVIIKYDGSEYATGYIDDEGYFVEDETTGGGGVGLLSTPAIKAGGEFTAHLTLMISNLNGIPVDLTSPFTASYGIITDFDDFEDTLAIKEGRLVSVGLLSILFGDEATEPLPGHTVTAELLRIVDPSPDHIKAGIPIYFDEDGDGVLDIDTDPLYFPIGIELGDKLTVRYLFSNDLLSPADNQADSTSSAIATFGKIYSITDFEELEVVIEDETTVVIPGLEDAIGLDDAAIAAEVTADNGYAIKADIYKEGESGAPTPLIDNIPVGLAGTVDISQLNITVGDRIQLTLRVNTRLIEDYTPSMLKMAPDTEHLFAGMTREAVMAFYIGVNEGKISVLNAQSFPISPWPSSFSGFNTLSSSAGTDNWWMKALLTGDISRSLFIDDTNEGVLVEDAGDELEIGDEIGVTLEFMNPLMKNKDGITWTDPFPIKLHGVLETAEQVAGLGLDISTDGKLHVAGPDADWQALSDSIIIHGSAYLGANSVERTNREPSALGSNIVLYNGLVENATNNIYDLTADKAKIGDVYGAELLAQRGVYLEQTIPGLESAPVTLGNYLTSTTAEVAPDLTSSKIYAVDGGFGSYADWQNIIKDYPDANMIFEVYKTGSFVPVFTKIFDASTDEDDFDLTEGKLYIGDMLADLNAKHGDEFTFYISLSNGVWLEDDWTLGTIKVDMYNLMQMHGIPGNSYVVIYDYDGGILKHSFLPTAYKVVEGKFNFFRFANNQDPQVKVVNTNKFQYGINTIKYRDWNNYADIESVSQVNLTRSWFTFKFVEGQYASTPADNDERTDNIHKIGVKTNFMHIGNTAPTYYHSIRAFAGNGGSITPSGAVSVPNGGNQSFIIRANEGYAVQAVIIDGVNRGALTAFTFTDVASDHSIVASFVKTVAEAAPGTGGLPPITIPTIPATGSVTLAAPAALMLLLGMAIIPKRRK